MAAFLHVAPGGMRFNNDYLGAWYATAEPVTAITEVAHLTGVYIDLRPREEDMPEIFAPNSYAESQHFGEAVRATENAGILYPSVRRTGGLNIVVYRPSLILNVRQG
jgi:RES domain-containing protein